MDINRRDFLTAPSLLAVAGVTGISEAAGSPSAAARPEAAPPK